MIARILGLSVRARWAVAFLTFLVVLFGAWQITLLPIDAVYAGITFYELRDAPAVMRAYRDWCETAPDAVTALWKDAMLRRLELQPLSRKESDQLLQVVLGGPVAGDCAERMWRLTRGNVLFLHHLVDHECESGRLADRRRSVLIVVQT